MGKMKWPLIGLCAFMGEKGIERRSAWISDHWLRKEIDRDPDLFRHVEFEIGYHEMPSADDTAYLHVPEAVLLEMANQFRLSLRK